MAGELYIGLMSGTSLDGVDAVIADFDAAHPLVASHYIPLSPQLRGRLEGLLHPGNDELARCRKAAIELSAIYASAVGELLVQTRIDRSGIRAIGCHGQTVRHMPQDRYTVQLVDGALLAESTGIGVVCDFRSRDLAAGGQGAPLVPAFHAAMFASPGRARAIVNLGGIANISHLGADGAVRGFDCGPANALLDEWITSTQGLAYDAGGRWAASGRVIQPLLDTLLTHPYFSLPPPKSTGRETFNLAWVLPHLEAGFRPEDVQATLAELSAATTADALRAHGADCREVYFCGGGVANRDLVDRIERRLPGMAVATTAVLGIDPDWIEALAFAWLAREMLAGRPGNVPAVTGAAGPRVLGCFYPP